MTATHRTRYWHVTLTLAGAEQSLADVERGLCQLADQHPFLLAGRYAASRAEISYWEEARDADQASALALGMWEAHRAVAALPDWQVVGLEVHEREAFRDRSHERRGLATGELRPF